MVTDSHSYAIVWCHAGWCTVMLLIFFFLFNLHHTYSFPEWIIPHLCRHFLTAWSLALVIQGCDSVNRRVCVCKWEEELCLPPTTFFLSFCLGPLVSVSQTRFLLALWFSSKMSARCKQTWHLHGENTARLLAGRSSGIHLYRNCLDWLHWYCLRCFFSLPVFKATLLYSAIFAISPQPLPHQICRHSHIYLLHTIPERFVAQDSVCNVET